CRVITERLSKMPNERWENVEHLRASGEGAVPGPEVLRDAFGVATLIEGGFGEADRERRDVPATVASSDRRYQARIDATAQEQTEWHVAAQPHGDRGCQQIFQLIDGLGEAPREGLHRLLERPVPERPRRRGAHPEHRPRGELVDAVPDRLGSRDISQGEERVQRREAHATG